MTKINKITFAIIFALLIQTSAYSAFWHKGEAVGNEIKQEEYPASESVEPIVKPEQIDENTTIKGGIENTLDVNLEACLKYALGNNPRIQSAMQDVFASDARIKQAWSSYFPQFTICQSYDSI